MQVSLENEKVLACLPKLFTNNTGIGRRKKKKKKKKKVPSGYLYHIFNLDYDKPCLL